MKKQRSLISIAAILIALSVFLGLYCGDALGIKEFIACAAGLILVTLVWIQADRLIVHGLKASQWSAIGICALSAFTYVSSAMVSYTPSCRTFGAVIELVSLIVCFGAIAALVFVSRSPKSSSGS